VVIGEIIPEIGRNASFRYGGAALLFGETDHPEGTFAGWESKLGG
jgi:hypothetical protein